MHDGLVPQVSAHGQPVATIPVHRPGIRRHGRREPH